MPRKRAQKSQYINCRCSPYTYIYSYLQLFACIYLHLLIYIHVLLVLLYELDKIDKIWGIKKPNEIF